MLRRIARPQTRRRQITDDLSDVRLEFADSGLERHFPDTHDADTHVIGRICQFVARTLEPNCGASSASTAQHACRAGISPLLVVAFRGGNDVARGLVEVGGKTTGGKRQSFVAAYGVGVAVALARE